MHTTPTRLNNPLSRYYTQIEGEGWADEDSPSEIDLSVLKKETHALNRMKFLNTCTCMYMYIGADLVYNRIIEYRCGVGERREGVGGRWGVLLEQLTAIYHLGVDFL